MVAASLVPLSSALNSGQIEERQYNMSMSCKVVLFLHGFNLLLLGHLGFV